MKLLDTLTRAADEEQLQLQPLPIHAAAAQPEHLRRHYALLLAAVLTAQPAVSEAQSRLLRLLLDALQLGDIRGALFDQARELAPEPLLEAARVIREAGFAAHLLLDVLVLLRLDAPLDDESVRLVGELAAFLGLDSEEVAIRARDTAQILGLEQESNFLKKTTNETESSNNHQENLNIISQFWPREISKKLTADRLRAGVKDGLWVIDQEINIDHPWDTDGATIKFIEGAKINSTSRDATVTIKNCTIINAEINFDGNSNVKIENCKVIGSYKNESKSTAFSFNGQSATITKSSFTTINARAIYSNETPITIEHCNFLNCGNPLLIGGAICITGNKTHSIKSSKFASCIGSMAGAVHLQNLRDVSHCNFYNCKSPDLETDKGEKISIALFANSTIAKKAVVSCTFRETSLDIGNTDLVYGSYPVQNCTFTKANSYSHYTRSESRWSTSKSADDTCIFSEGRTIEGILKKGKHHTEKPDNEASNQTIHGAIQNLFKGTQV